MERPAGNVVRPAILEPALDTAFEPRWVPPPSFSRTYEIVASRGGMDVRRSTADAIPLDVPGIVRKAMPQRPGMRTHGARVRTPGPPGTGTHTSGVRARTSRLLGMRARTPKLSEIPRVSQMSPKHLRVLTFTCPKEWRETWLWKVCRDRGRRES